MKTIATINLKGGVGKTTVTWCLADVLANFGRNEKILLFDLDAQMSLTQAIALNADTGSIKNDFGKWYADSKAAGKTIFHALDKFAMPKTKGAFNARGRFDFEVGYDFIYKLTDNLHFVPSHEQLYWLDLDVFERSRVKHFIRVLLNKIERTKGIEKYDYVLFDCPPSFTFLSYSVLAACDLALVPVNPDFFASSGVSLLLGNLKLRMEPSPIPKIGVFMNKAKTWGNEFTKETEYYWDRVKEKCEDAAKQKGVNVQAFDARIPERASIKNAIMAYGVPPELAEPFKDLWLNIIQFLTYARK